MNVYVNGQPQVVSPPLTILQLLEQLETQLPQVAVEVNEHLVPRQEHSARQLQEGDRIEIVTLVGGG